MSDQADQARSESRPAVALGVCGGIAAYKTAMLARRLVQSGADVHVIMTAAAQQFVGQATFAALTGRPVASEVFDPNRQPLGAHIELAEDCDVLCVAPATANFLAKAATGLADDLLATLYLAFDGPILIAPAMNAQMWASPAVQRNVEQLRLDGAHFVDPEEGWQSCRRDGAGRMAEPESIRARIESLLPSR